ncbi:MAG: hypothetical protein U1F42_03305 [Candidatus Competibacteraceae bacterium]
MDRAKVNAATPFLAPPVVAPSSELLMSRLGAYWRALGVTDPDQVAALSEQALRRLSNSPETLELDTVARAVIAASDLLDDWLAHALGLSRPSRALAAARAALLSGAAPDWPVALFAPPGAELGAILDTLRAAVAEPTPAPGSGVMPVQRIELFSLLGPLRRL